MNIVLVFRQKIFGYGFGCEEDQLINESTRIRDRLDRYLLKNHILKKCFVTKYESSGRIFKGFIGFLSEDVPVFPIGLEEAEIEAGKYLKFGYLYGTDRFGARLCVDKSVRAYLKENNIRTDWMRFSSGKNSYLRIVN